MVAREAVRQCVVREATNGATVQVVEVSADGKEAWRKTVYLAHLRSPRWWSRQMALRANRETEEEWAWEAREYLRKLSIGKPVWVLEYGEVRDNEVVAEVYLDAQLKVNLAAAVIRGGYTILAGHYQLVNMKDPKRQRYHTEVTAAQDEAKRKRVGMHAQGGKAVAKGKKVQFNPSDREVAGLIETYKTKELKAIVEYVISDTLLSMYLPETRTFLVVQLSGLQRKKAGDLAAATEDEQALWSQCHRDAQETTNRLLMHRDVLLHLDALMPGNQDRRDGARVLGTVAKVGDKTGEKRLWQEYLLRAGLLAYSRGQGVQRRHSEQFAKAEEAAKAKQAGRWKYYQGGAGVVGGEVQSPAAKGDAAKEKGSREKKREDKEKDAAPPKDAKEAADERGQPARPAPRIGAGVRKEVLRRAEDRGARCPPDEFEAAFEADCALYEKRYQLEEPRPAVVLECLREVARDDAPPGAAHVRAYLLALADGVLRKSDAVRGVGWYYAHAATARPPGAAPEPGAYARAAPLAAVLLPAATGYADLAKAFQQAFRGVADWGAAAGGDAAAAAHAELLDEAWKPLHSAALDGLFDEAGKNLCLTALVTLNAKANWPDLPPGRPDGAGKLFVGMVRHLLAVKAVDRAFLTRWHAKEAMKEGTRKKTETALLLLAGVIEGDDAAAAAAAAAPPAGLAADAVAGISVQELAGRAAVESEALSGHHAFAAALCDFFDPARRFFEAAAAGASGTCQALVAAHPELADAAAAAALGDAVAAGDTPFVAAARAGLPDVCAALLVAHPHRPAVGEAEKMLQEAVKRRLDGVCDHLLRRGVDFPPDVATKALFPTLARDGMEATCLTLLRGGADVSGVAPDGRSAAACATAAGLPAVLAALARRCEDDEPAARRRVADEEAAAWGALEGRRRAAFEAVPKPAPAQPEQLCDEDDVLGGLTGLSAILRDLGHDLDPAPAAAAALPWPPAAAAATQNPWLPTGAAAASPVPAANPWLPGNGAAVGAERAKKVEARRGGGDAEALAAVTERVGALERSVAALRAQQEADREEDRENRKRIAALLDALGRPPPLDAAALTDGDAQQRLDEVKAEYAFNPKVLALFPVVGKVLRVLAFADAASPPLPPRARRAAHSWLQEQKRLSALGPHSYTAAGPVPPELAPWCR